MAIDVRKFNGQLKKMVPYSLSKKEHYSSNFSGQQSHHLLQFVLRLELVVFRNFTIIDCCIRVSGLSCSTPTTPSTFLPGGLVKYSLAFQPDPFHGHLQLRFRTRERGGELFRLLDQHHKEYLILEVSN